MFGVVLWSDTVNKQAVIWCDDHGDLAFYRNAKSKPKMSFRAGDLVEFDLQEDAALRIASCPRVVEKESYPSLTSDLKNAGVALGALKGICETPNGPMASPVAGQSADVVPFAPRRLDAVA